MAKDRTYTDAGYIETQWAKDGQLVCIVSAEVSEDGATIVTDMHQVTSRSDMDRIIAILKRARRQAFSA